MTGSGSPPGKTESASGGGALFPSDRRRVLADRAGRWVINAGGVAIIASVLGILVFILAEVWPLLDRPAVGPVDVLPWDAPGTAALIVDEHRTHAAGISLDGRVRVISLHDGRIVLDRAVSGDPQDQGEVGPGFIGVAGVPGQPLFAAAARDGSIRLIPVEWAVSFDGAARVVTPRIGDPIDFPADPSGRPPSVLSASLDADGQGAVAALYGDGILRVVSRSARENLLTGEITERFSTSEAASPRLLSRLLMDSARTNLYGATDSGEILWWRVREGVVEEPEIVSVGSRAITALSLLIGDRALVVGQEDGALSVWFPVRDGTGRFSLRRIRDFDPHGGAIRLIAPSMRNKGFLAQDSGGTLGLYYSTSHRTLWRGPSPLADATAIAFAPKADGLVLASEASVASAGVRNSHPESSLKAFFGKVWYEGAGEPQHVWQSSGGTDDFEPKLSLTPLAVGTLKGTIYSLILAVPLGVLGAMYTSQFMHPSVQRYVKPAVEIMAALPSVVIGFIAGLWLAPRLEALVPALILIVLMTPLLVVAAGLIWDRTVRPGARGMRRGIEVVVLMAAVSAAIWLGILLGPPFEAAAFGGDFQQWLLETTGLQYDQRNALVVGLAMGFAVIPIIFAISEDAFSNVPQSLVSGSLALGADRWRTVTRVVLPMASPGIFSAIMIGFGRAVGETMIVLMATGNTPIMDWSPFNGFRTLSANIAVEIPEAPHGDTLYRTLFLSGLLLFIVTFAMNTVAEIVRMRLRKKYAQL